MSYFKTSYETLQTLAHAGRYEDVAGFLVLARHASGLAHAGFEPYKLSGAGVNSIHEKAGLSEETARGAVESLRTLGLIRAASAETRRAFYFARWEIVQGALDLDLPHTVVDSSKDGSVDSALRRLKKARLASPGYAEKLTKVSDNDLRLDALMLLLAVYRHTSMSKFGGLSPNCIRRIWEVKSQTARHGGVRWGAEPSQYISNAYHDFIREAMARLLPKKSKDGPPPEEVNTRFWNAWNTIRETGLVYEAVCLYDTNPEPANEGQLRFTIRVNDYHAGSIAKSGDPSLLRSLELSSGSRFAYYTPADNDRGEAEAMWVVLPEKRGALVGVWRPRFRCANQDTGRWIDEENERIEATVAAIEAAAPAEQ